MIGLLAILCVIPFSLSAKVNGSVRANVSGLVDVNGYQGLKVRTIRGWNIQDLQKSQASIPYYQKIVDAQRQFDKKESSFIGSDPRPAKYNLTRSPNIDFLYEHYRDDVGVYGGMAGVIHQNEPYFNDTYYNINDFHIPAQYVDELFIDIGQRGGSDEGIGFMLVILNDSEVVYYSDSNKLYEYWSGDTQVQPTRAILKVNKPMKVSVVSFKTNGDGFFERISLRKLPKDITYTVEMKSAEDKELGDNTLSNILYDLKLVNPYVDKGNQFLDKNNPFYIDFVFNAVVNHELYAYIPLNNLTSYYIEGDKVYTRIGTRSFIGDKLQGARGEYLGYGIPPLSWVLELPLKQGVPVLQHLVDLAHTMGYSEQDRFIILNDANRRWDYNAQNIQLVNELDGILKRNNIHLYLIGEYDENLFGPLLENK